MINTAMKDAINKAHIDRWDCRKLTCRDEGKLAKKRYDSAHKKEEGVK